MVCSLVDIVQLTTLRLRTKHANADMRLSQPRQHPPCRHNPPDSNRPNSLLVPVSHASAFNSIYTLTVKPVHAM